MDKLNNYNGSIDLISGLRPKNNGNFPLMEAHDVVVDENGTRLDEALAPLKLSTVLSVGETVSLSNEDFTAIGTAVYANNTSAISKIKYYITGEEQAKPYTAFLTHSAIDIATGILTLQYKQYVFFPSLITITLTQTSAEVKIEEGLPNVGEGGGVSQYNLSTVLEFREINTLNEEDTQAFASLITANTGKYLKDFQNIGVLISGEEGEGYQAYVGVINNPIFANEQLVGFQLIYQGTLDILYFNVDLATQTITAEFKTNNADWIESLLPVYEGENEGGTTGGTGSLEGLVKKKVTLAELQAMCTAENIGNIVYVNIKRNTIDTLPLPDEQKGLLELMVISGNMFFIGVITNFSSTSQSLIGITKTNTLVTASGSIISFITLTNTLINLNVEVDGESSSFTELLTDTYFDFYIYTQETVSGGGSGGGSDGLTIKQITFTDRPSLLTWLNSNELNIVKAVFRMGSSAVSTNTVFMTATNRFVFSVSATAYAESSYVTYGHSCIITDTETYIDLDMASQIPTVGSSLTANASSITRQTLPDAYWTAQEFSVTIYYIG